MRALTYALILLLCFGVVVPHLSAQGCSQCRDTISQTNPDVQASYRIAIIVMISAVIGVASAATLVLRRMR